MGNQAKPPRSFNTIRNSQSKVRAKRYRQSRVVLLLMGAVILLIALSLLVLGVCALVDALTSAPAEPQTPGTPPAVAVKYDKKLPLDTTQIYKGELILVNNTHKYQFPTSITWANVSKQQSKTEEGLPFYDYGENEALVMEQTAFDAFELMMRKYYEASASGDELVLLADAYRDQPAQEFLYNNGSSTTKPGHSDHHTGYCIALKDSNGNGLSADHWIMEYCYKYGFIMRYPDAKQAQTGVSGYQYCLRYVGVGHATYMKEHNLCLEEYIDLLQTKKQSDPLRITINGKQAYEVYYVQKSGTGELTTINVPSNYSYRVSGDNDNGFIVTVDLSSPKSE